MKTLVRIVATLLLATSFAVSDTDMPRFIQKEGVYEIAPEITLTISSDASGALHYSLRRVYRYPDGQPSEVTYSNSLEASFLFYWDTASQILWLGTPKLILVHDAEGQEANDVSAKTLARAPEPFRREVRRMFKVQP